MAAEMKRLAGQTVVYGMSNVIPRMLNYLLTPYLTFIMGSASYGEVTDLYSIIPFVLVILTLGLESGYFRFAGKAESEEQKRNIFATTWGAVSLVSLIFMALVLIFNGRLAVIFDYASQPSYIWLMGAIITVDAVSAIPFARLRQQFRAKRYAALKIVNVLVNIVFTIFFYSLLPWLASRGIMTSLWSQEFGAGYVLVSNLIASGVTLIMLIPDCGGIAPRIDRRLLRTIMAYSLPLLISGIAGTANEFIDRQMIKFLSPEDEWRVSVAIYGATAKVGVVMLLFTQMYRFAAEPFFLAEFKEDDFHKSNAEAMKYYIIVSVAIFLLVGLYADLFGLLLIRNAELRTGMFMLPVMLVSNMLSGVVLNLSFWYKQMSRTWMAIWITGTGLVFTIVFNVLLVPRMGYFGAALARLICEVAMVVLSYLLGQRHCPVPYDLRRIGEYVLLGAALYGAGQLAGGLPAWGRYSLYLALVLIFVIYAVRREKIDVRGFVRSLLRRR